ncbi:LemA family protein [Mobilitalea sibirica]|uniref:LemA family protein n=2 Tax=Mobilitalea sibirica TaxID=1462919 RepID=A0A8J7H2K0_9FIRM|nr:LemA family protein [Mobilitalea sibirica]
MNSLRRAEVKIDEALSDIDVALTKRYDVLLKMLDVCKGYAKYEKETILETIKLRSGMNMEVRKEASSEMDQAVSFIHAVAENYPELRSSDNFKQLQAAIMDVEEHLQAARRLYNSNISYLNQRIVSFPTSIVANQINIRPREFFEADEIKRQDVKMEI